MHVGSVSGNVHNITQVHHHLYPAQPATPEVVRRDVEPFIYEQPRAEEAAVKAQAPTPAQRDVLALMDPLDKSTRYRVLQFMRDNFGTAMVVELQPVQVYRVRRYVETINSRRREKA